MTVGVTEIWTSPTCQSTGKREHALFELGRRVPGVVSDAREAEHELDLGRGRGGVRVRRALGRIAPRRRGHVP